MKSIQEPKKQLMLEHGRLLRELSSLEKQLNTYLQSKEKIHAALSENLLIEDYILLHQHIQKLSQYIDSLKDQIEKTNYELGRIDNMLREGM